MSPNYQAVQNMLSWEVSAFLAQRLQSYHLFKFKAFVWEIKTWPHYPRSRVFTRIQMSITPRQMRI